MASSAKCMIEPPNGYGRVVMWRVLEAKTEDVGYTMLFDHLDYG